MTTYLRHVIKKKQANRKHVPIPENKFYSCFQAAWFASVNKAVYKYKQNEPVQHLAATVIPINNVHSQVGGVGKLEVIFRNIFEVLNLFTFAS